uniref:PID domain-containing protein n=1 Tax=Glossina morsitans morsitans TaxID=37546 RepID=A0A340TYK5_GLOMM
MKIRYIVPLERMVTYKSDNQVVAMSKMNSVRSRKANGSNSSEFHLLESDLQESSSSVSRNSIYKLKIDLMFDDTSRSIRSNRLDDPRGSHRTRSIIMYGRSELASTAGESARSITSYLHESSEASKMLTDNTKKDVQRISNSVQAQIEQLFTDVAKDATSSFPVTCLGSLPLKEKVTSLQGLQQPLRELYFREMADKKQKSGFLEICANGLRIKINSNNGNNRRGANANNDSQITPFHNIAVWSAVKFVVSKEDGGAAFLPLITSPENIDKNSLFQPLSSPEQQRLSNNPHAPIFAVVMRSAEVSKMLECHGFICKSTEDAIVIAATLYQSLMSHVSSNTHRSTKRRTPRNQNGVSCMSIASSSGLTGSNYHQCSQHATGDRKTSLRSSGGSVSAAPITSRSSRKKRISSSSLSSSSNIINEGAETTTEERKRKSHKTKRAPPIPTSIPAEIGRKLNTGSHSNSTISDAIKKFERLSANEKNSYRSQSIHPRKPTIDSAYKAPKIIEEVNAQALGDTSANTGLRGNDNNGDILTRVAIPRSGSFLNTGGLTRYKSRAARRHTDKLNGNGGGGGGSPLGFSELFNEFRLHENLHSLDEILYAIIDADGMSFNDLKPIYKEFLLKLAVTLTKDELFQRSKNIMRRQRKKKQKRKTSSNGSQKKVKTAIFGTKNLKKVFQLGQFRSCRGKSSKPPRNKELANQRKSEPPPITIIQSPTITSRQNTHARHQQLHQSQQHQRNRLTTSGSDVSVVPQENAFLGMNRNSSSGYVSCSECSYDSEACTCTSADRCYCSLRAKQINNYLRRKTDRKHSKKSEKNKLKNNNNKRSSYISCKSDEKCYCSMVEEEDRNGSGEEDSGNIHSDTTWCDTDSCESASKCYCKQNERKHTHKRIEENVRDQSHKSRPNGCKTFDKLGLDYELFNINGNTKSVEPQEALSVKKSVEAAAIFADVKLSQTTDIKSLCNGNTNSKDIGSCRSHSVATRKLLNSYRKRESFSIGRHNERNTAIRSLSSNSSQKSCSADDLLSKLSYIEKNIARAASVHSGRSKTKEIILRENFQNNYQSMRAVSASLEETLGYLP